MNSVFLCTVQYILFTTLTTVLIIFMGGLLFVLGAAAVFCLYRWLKNKAQYGVVRNTNNDSRSLYQYLSGNFLDPRKCEIDWGNGDAVGETFSFVVKFFYNNGQQYPISEDELDVEVEVGTSTITPILQFLQEDETANKIKISFAVRRSGTYTIVLKCANLHILDSPFSREFFPGPLSSEHTVVLRTTHSMLSVVTMTQEKNHKMEIIPRDSFDNNCNDNLTKYDLDDHFSLILVEVNSLDYNPPFVWSIEKKYSSQRLMLNFTVFQTGCYKADLQYKGKSIKNGTFDVIVLTVEESDEVESNIDKNNLHIWFECRLLPQSALPEMEAATSSQKRQRGFSLSDIQSIKNPMNRKRLKSLGQGSQKQRKVYCYLTGRQLIIREYFLKIFYHRIHTFRLSPSTQLICSENDDETGLPVLLINDGFQNIGLICARRNILVATFVGILFNHMGRSECYDEKVTYFQKQLLQHHQVTNGRDKLELTIDRNDILNSSYRALKDVSVSNWLKQFVINFKHETGLDWGGLNREWIHLLCKAIFHPREEGTGDGTASSGMFRAFNEDPQALVLPNPATRSGYKLKYYELAGKLVGKCLLESALGGQNSRQVNARFARSFLSQMVGLPVSLMHFENDDPDLYTTKIKYILNGDITEDDDITFSEEEYSNERKLIKIIELVPNGKEIAVTNENKHKYLDMMAQNRLKNCIKSEIEAFLKGLNALVPDEMLGAFDENEVELLLCGLSKISVQDLKANCVVNGFRGKILEWFWALLSSFTQAELARLLQFTTGCSHLPPDGFKSLEPPFKISYACYNEGALPTAHTCFNELCLPHYDSYEEMHRMVKIALTEGATGFGLV